MDRVWIEKYAAGAAVPAQLLAGLTPAELNAVPVQGTWSLQQIFLHLMDSDLIGSERMKRVIAEENPILRAYDETAFANRLAYDHQDVEMACEIFRLNRIMTAALLRGLSDEVFARAGQHTERGHETLADLVQGYVEHLDHHLKFIHEKRRLLGKPPGG